MPENSKIINDLLKNANPAAVNEIKRMASSGELDGIKGKLSNFNKAELLGALSKSGGDLNSLKNDPKLRSLANDPAMQAILARLSQK